MRDCQQQRQRQQQLGDLYFGLTPEQLQQVTEAAVKGATGPLIDRVAEISKTLGVIRWDSKLAGNPNPKPN
jgi:hypothetical protein